MKYLLLFPKLTIADNKLTLSSLISYENVELNTLYYIILIILL